MRAMTSAPTVVAVAGDSPAERAGILIADEVLSVNGVVPRDIIEWRVLTDEPLLDLEVVRGGIATELSVEKGPGEPLGIEISSAVFDRVRTCDNHCPFCFIYQLPPGMRKSLYLKDDDYRLSFLYGNFTTLTRFTESDVERIIDEGLSPLNVSIHATDPDLRSHLLRNSKGAVSLRWLRVLLDNGIRVSGQIVVCPGLNDGDVLDRTLNGILDDFPELHSVAAVPLGISRYNSETSMRPHTVQEAERVLDVVNEWQQIFLTTIGRRMIFAADEYFLMAGRPFPQESEYEEFALHEDGIGMARTFELEFNGRRSVPTGPTSGFFAWVDGAPADGYRALRNPASETGLRRNCGASDGELVQAVTLRRKAGAPETEADGVGIPIGILTGEYGAQVLVPLIESLGRDDVRVIPVKNEYFGGNIGVSGLMVGEDVSRVLDGEPRGHRYLLPDVCLSEGRFLDGMTLSDLAQPVEVISTDGLALRRAVGVAG